MPNKINANKGIAIYLVLGALIMAVVLAKVILNLIFNQANIGHHRQGRVQAYYASLAGMNYAIEKLRNGSWTAGDCTVGAPCYIPEDEFPPTIESFDGSGNRQFRIIFCPAGSDCGGDFDCLSPPAGATVCVYSSVQYTATP